MTDVLNIVAVITIIVSLTSIMLNIRMINNIKKISSKLNKIHVEIQRQRDYVPDANTEAVSRLNQNLMKVIGNKWR